MQGVVTKGVISHFIKGRSTIFAFTAFALKEWCCFFAAGYHSISPKPIFYHQEDAVKTT